MISVTVPCRLLSSSFFPRLLNNLEHYLARYTLAIKHKIDIYLCSQDAFYKYLREL